MSVFVSLAQFTLSNDWQYTDVVIGSYFRVTHLTEPKDDNGVAVESSAAIAQVDIARFVYTQEAFKHQSEPQRFILELPQPLEVRRLGFKLLPGQIPWSIKIEALDATILPGQTENPSLANYYTKNEVDALLKTKQDKTRSTNKDILIYSAVASPSCNFFPDNDISKLNDNNLSSGAIKNGGGYITNLVFL
jgi:hypothetical protein